MSVGILRGDYKVVRNSNDDMVKAVEREFDEDVTFFTQETDRMYDAWGAYIAIDGSSWEREKLQALRERNATALSFNLLGSKVDTLAGSIVSDMPDSDWVPAEGERSSVTEAIRPSYYQDKELTNWDAALIEVIRDGLVHIGWARLGETKKYNPRGNISLTRVVPGMFIPARNWKSGDDRDLMRGTMVGYYTAEGLAHKYEAKGDDIRRAMEDAKRNAAPMPQNAAMLRQRYARQVGDEYMVIESHWVELLRKKRLVAQRMNTNTWIPFPLEIGDDQQLCLMFAQENQLDMSSAIVEDYEDMIHHVSTVCPGLSTTLLLENEKSRIQPKGMPFYHFSVADYNGMHKGVVGDIMALQRTVDQRLTYEHEAMAKANGGATFWNKSLFADDAEWQAFVQNKNKLGAAIKADLDGVQKIKERIDPEFNMQNVHQNLATMIRELLPMVSRVSDSMSAVSDTSTSGILFERQYQINRIGNLLMDKGVKQLVNNIGEGYFYQWQLTYGDDEPRQIPSRDGKRGVTLNERVLIGLDEAGNFVWGIANNPRYAPRCRVLVTESARAGTQQIYRRHLLSDMLGILMKSPEANMAQIQAMFKEFVSTADFGEKMKAAVETAAQLDAMRVQMQVITDLAAMNAKTKESGAMALQFDIQARQLLQQLQMTIMQQAMGGGAPMQPQAGPAKSGIPVDIVTPENEVRDVPIRQNVQTDVQVGTLPAPPNRQSADMTAGPQ